MQSIFIHRDTCPIEPKYVLSFNVNVYQFLNSN